MLFNAVSRVAQGHCERASVVVVCLRWTVMPPPLLSGLGWVSGAIHPLAAQEAATRRGCLSPLMANICDC